MHEGRAWDAAGLWCSCGLFVPATTSPAGAGLPLRQVLWWTLDIVGWTPDARMRRGAWSPTVLGSVAGAQRPRGNVVTCCSASRIMCAGGSAAVCTASRRNPTKRTPIARARHVLTATPAPLLRWVVTIKACIVPTAGRCHVSRRQSQPRARSFLSPDSMTRRRLTRRLYSWRRRGCATSRGRPDGQSTCLPARQSA